MDTSVFCLRIHLWMLAALRWTGRVMMSTYDDSLGIAPTRNCTHFLIIGFVVAGGRFYSYYIHQGYKSNKERKIVRKNLSFMHTKRFNSFFKRCVQFLVYPLWYERISLNINWCNPQFVKGWISFVYQKALVRTFNTSFLNINNLCEFTALEHKFKRCLVLKNRF